MRSCLYEGTVRHRRRGAGAGEFQHRLLMAYLDLDELPGALAGSRLWSATAPALAWFRRADYLGDPGRPLAECVRALVSERTGLAVEGPVRLLTNLRWFGQSFNPVSFYYCFAPDGRRVQAVVAEVTNTPWGERHCYVMPVAEGAEHAEHGGAAVLSASFPKQLHVSPLMGMDHVYDWRLTEPGERLSVHIESHRSDGQSLFDATLALGRRELTPRAMRRALLRYPFQTTVVLARIYAHALALRLRGAPWFPHPRRGALPT